MYDRDYARQEGLEGFQPMQEAAVFLARQRAKGEASAWAPHMRLLPRGFSELPKHWEPALLKEAFAGCDVLEHIEADRREAESDWERVRPATGDLTWADYEWGHDCFVTRAAYWNGTEREGSVLPRRVGTSALWPLHDLLPHGLPANADYSFDRELQALRIEALAPVRKGELFFVAYFKQGQRLSREVLTKWGFISEHAIKVVNIPVPPRDGVEEEPLPMALESTLDDGAARAFLAVLRARAANGSPLQLRRELPEDTVGLPDPSSGWVYWWNQKTGETSWVLPGDPNEPYHLPATTWRLEAPALQAAERLLAKAEAAYPGTLAEDEALLAAGIQDARLRNAVLHRRDEKAIIAWWLSTVRRALTKEGAPDDEVDVASVYAEQAEDATLPATGDARQRSDEL